MKYKITSATYITADGRRRNEAISAETNNLEQYRKQLKQSENCKDVRFIYETIK